MSFWSLPVVKCSVVPYCIECTHWGSQKSNRIGRMLLDKSVDSKYLLCKTRSPWTRSILLMKERWMPKQIAIIYLRGFVCADSTNFFGASLLNCSFRTESRVTHALVRCVLILMASLSLWWNLLHSIHSFIHSFWYLFRTILLRSVHGESLRMRVHSENNILVVSRSPRARPFAFNHLETFVWFWFDYFT